MANDYTTTELIADVKQRASVPTNQNLITDTALIRFLDNKLKSDLVPLVISAREEYFVHTFDHAITTASADTNEYKIPPRAIGMKLKDVTIVSSNGNDENPVPRLTYRDKALPAFTDYQRIWGFWVKANYIKLHIRTTFIGDTLRLYYFRRPNRLVATSRAGEITNIDVPTKVVTLDNAPTDWTTNTTFDVIKGEPGFHSVADDQTITNKTGFDLTFSSLPDDMEVGDFVAEAGESPIPQIPWEGFPLLAQLGAIKILEALGDKTGWQVATQEYQVLRTEFLKLLSPRVDDQPQRIVARKGIWRTRGAQYWRR
jgi:hypothetical protein